MKEKETSADLQVATPVAVATCSVSEYATSIGLHSRFIFVLKKNYKDALKTRDEWSDIVKKAKLI